MTTESQAVRSDNNVVIPVAVAKDGGKVQLKKELRLLQAVSVIVGHIIGTGIFVSPSGVFRETGSVGYSLLVWVFCGVLSTMGALCYVELGTLVPESGGDFAYIRKAFGDFPAFLFMWDAVFVFVPTSNAIQGITFANYILKPIYGSCPPPNDVKRLVAAAAITFLTFLNCWSMKATKKVQDVFLVTKVTALLVVIVAGMCHLAAGHYENFERPFEGSTDSVANLAVAFYGGIFAYNGYNSLNFMVEEVKNPAVNLPRAVYISMPMVTFLYVLANVAYTAVLPPATMLSSEAIAVSFSDRMLGFMSWIMPAFVAASALGALSVHIMTSARICFKAASVGMLPDSMALVSFRKTPAVALSFLCLLSLCVLVSSDVYALIEYSGFVAACFISLSVAALLRFRLKLKDVDRPVKVPMFIPIGFLIICAFLVTLPVLIRWQQVAVALGITASGVPAYFIFVKWSPKPKCIVGIIDSITKTMQIVFLSVPQDDYGDDDSESAYSTPDSEANKDPSVMVTPPSSTTICAMNSGEAENVLVDFEHLRKRAAQAAVTGQGRD